MTLMLLPVVWSYCFSTPSVTVSPLMFHSLLYPITVSAMGNDKIDAILKKYEGQIKDEVLAVTVVYGEVSGYSKEWNINGEQVTLGVERK